MDNIGLLIIEEIISQEMIDCEQINEGGVKINLFKWAGNAPEQLEALCHDYFSTQKDSSIIKEYLN